LPRVLIAAGLTALLGACVSVQVPPLPAGDLPSHWHNAPRLGTRPDLTGWWRHFHDPHLDALVERALRDNPGVAAAAWKLRAARALEDASTATFKPQASFGTLEQPNPENTASYFQAGFDATWEFGLFGRSGANAHIASANTSASAAELQSARVSLVAEVVREYLQLRATQRDQALLQDAARTAERTVQLLNERERLQLASRLDVEHARAAAAAADARLAGTGAAIAGHAQTLALLLGQGEPDPAWLDPKPLPQLHDSDFVALPADLLRTRPDIRYAQAQVLKAAGALGIAKADLYPRIALGSSLTFSALVKGHTELGDVNDTFAIGPIIDIPLFDWGQRRAVRDARADQLQAALLAYRQAVLQGAAEVETGLATLHASAQRLRAADAAVAATQQGVLFSETLQSLGQADAIDNSRATAANIDSEVARVQARLAHGLAYVALYKALGGAPLPPADDATAATPGKSPGRTRQP
jgi:NodT family efflux transporter outer membrane factor (OMF) lipoprotein